LHCATMFRQQSRRKPRRGGRLRRSVAAVLLLVLLASACAPVQPRGGDGQTPGNVASGPKTITIGIIAEPTGIGPFSSHTSGGGAHQVEEIAQRYLVGLDNQSQPYPELAAEVPDADLGTWTIAPDGTMETTYRLRTGVKWHDGTPMVADDWVFGWEVDHDPTMPNATNVPVRYIDAATAIDDTTLLLHWSKTSPFRN